MTKVLVTDSHLSDIADAIRGKNGSSTTYKPGQMAAAITALPDASVFGTKSVTQNGTYDPSDDSLDGYSEVTVNVPNSYAAGDEGKVVSNGALVAQSAMASEITINGTYDTTLNDEVTVNVSGGGGSVTPLFTNKTLLNPNYSQTFALVDGRIVTGFHATYGFIAPYNGTAWMDFDWTNDWEIGVAFKVATTSGNFSLFGVENNTSYYAACPGAEVINGSIGFGVSASRDSWTLFDYIPSSQGNTKYSVQSDKWYFLSLSYDSTAQKVTAKITDDFESWATKEDAFTQTPYTNSSYKIGFGGLIKNSGHTQASACIDLYNTYIKTNGAIAWGCFTGELPE